MTHPAPGRSTSAPRRRARWALLALAGLALPVLACEDDGTGPDELPFGRTGEVRVEVRTPRVSRRGGPQGELQQIVTWRSDGTWRITERIFYQGRLGDETLGRSTEAPEAVARRYSSWIGLVNDSTPVQLFLPDFLSPDLVPTCQPPQSRVTVSIVDSERPDSISWTRCGEGSLASLEADNANPGPFAGRVIEAAKLVRNFTVGAGREFVSAYEGSLPFYSVDRGEQSKTPLLLPRVIEDAATWAAFWAQHTGASAPAPSVDFTRDLVLVGAVGTRQEAGDSVEVRRVLPVDFGTQVSLWERRPGNFCTPAPRAHAPFHIVVAPAQVPRPIFFSVEQLDPVPCG